MKTSLGAHVEPRSLPGWAAVVAVAGIAVYVLTPLIQGVLWAMLLAYWTWPVHQRLRRHVTPLIAAGVMTFAVIALAVVPSLWGLAALRGGVVVLREVLPAALDGVLPRIHGWVSALPMVGKEVAESIPESLAELDIPVLVKSGFDALGGFAASALLRAGSGLFHIAIAALSLFFLYRDGPRWLATGQRRLIELFGNPGADACATIKATAAAVTRGVLLAALAQGAIAGLGYWVAGVPSALGLALVTSALALVPLGAALVWIPAATWLFLSGNPLAAAGLLAWGAVVVSSVDNLLRPMLMRGRSMLSFWPLTLSLIGGALTLGLPGVYVGPIALSLLARWWEGDESADEVTAARQRDVPVSSDRR